jgi:hypothetical protein
MHEKTPMPVTKARSPGMVVLVRRLLEVALTFAIVLASGCSTTAPDAPGGHAPGVGRLPPGAPSKADEFLIVDCLLPGEVRKLGTSMVYLSPRRPVKTSARDCEIRGGEYVAYDRADYRTALKVWLDLAEKSDPAAQTYVGEIYEKGLGVPPDYGAAAQWYRRAAEAGYPRAAINLGALYEQGLGVPRDPVQALNWYRKGSGVSAISIVAPSDAAVTVHRPATAPPDAQPPRIELLQPELVLPVAMRDIRIQTTLPIATIPPPPQEVTLVGRLTSPNPLKSLTVNGRPETPTALFTTRLLVKQPEERVRVTAVDSLGLTSTLEFLIVNRQRESGGGPPPSPPRFGRYHALIIGNNDYPLLRPLQTAVSDARDIARVLGQHYGFTVTLLLNATRYEILSALNVLRAQLPREDNLLIYYAGHGELDRVNQRGHWLPVDAEPNSPANWISNISVTDILNAMNVQQLLVIADSCYSGAMARSAIGRLDADLTDADRARALETLGRKRSRMVLTSGGLEPVADSAGGPHSPFAQVLLELLNANQGALSGQELFRRLQVRLVAMTQGLSVHQVPEYAPIGLAGHEAGDFVFVAQR